MSTTTTPVGNITTTTTTTTPPPNVHSTSEGELVVTLVFAAMLLVLVMSCVFGLWTLLAKHRERHSQRRALEAAIARAGQPIAVASPAPNELPPSYADVGPPPSHMRKALERQTQPGAAEVVSSAGGAETISLQSVAVTSPLPSYNAAVNDIDMMDIHRQQQHHNQQQLQLEREVAAAGDLERPQRQPPSRPGQGRYSRSQSPFDRRQRPSDISAEESLLETTETTGM